MNSNRLICATAIVAVALASLGMPSRPGRTVLFQPDGTEINVQIIGDEHGSAILSADGSRQLQRDSRGWLVDAGPRTAAESRVLKNRASSPLRIIGEANTFPSHGRQRALAIIVDFPSTEHHPEGKPFMYEQPRQLFDSLFNAKRFDTLGATGSVHQYYFDNSRGVFDLTFDVYGPVTMSRDMSFYSTKTNGQDLNAWNMVVEACTALDGQIDFKDYDRDNDGVIDNVYIIYAGAGAATGGDPATCIWQHAGDVETITGRRYEFDGVRLNHYACSNEFRAMRDSDGVMRPQLEGIGTVVHEFSHVMGLPDLYDTRNGAIFTPGEWSLMDTGCHLNDSRTPPMMSAYERSMLGWLEPRVIGTKPESVTLRDIYDNEACRINTASNADEYFVLENRQQRGWDAYLPGHGLLIWHINYMPQYWEYNQVNTLPNYLGVDILRADGQLTDGSLSGDTYPGTKGVTTLTDDGYPNMRSLDGKPTNAPLSAIREAAGLITFDVCRLVQQLDRVSDVRVERSLPESARIVWKPVSQAGAAYRIGLYGVDSTGQRQPVGAYNNLVVADTTVQLKNLVPETDYVMTVTAVHGQVEGQASEPLEWRTPAMSFEYLQPTALEADQVDDGSFVAHWQAVDGAESYLLDVFTKQQGQPDEVLIDFTGGLEQLPGGWSTNCSFTIGMNGYYGQQSPALSMGDDYSRIQSPVLDGNLRGIEFWYRERSGSGTSHAEVWVMSGDRWQLADSLPLPAKMGAGVAYRLAEGDSRLPGDARAVKIIYRRDGKGTLALDDIRLLYGDHFTSVPMEAWTDRNVGASTSCRVDSLQSDVTYYYTLRAVSAEGIRTLPSSEIAVRTLAAASVGNVTAVSAALRVDSDGNVSVDGFDGEVSLHDINGRRLARLPLHIPGVYIVRAGAQVFKYINR